MSTVPAETGDYSDAELIASVRDGTTSAYATLYERHVTAAHNLARQLASSTAEADDLVSDAFTKVLNTLESGKGPDSSFRAYLLTALRHAAYDKTRKDSRVDLNEDMTDAGGAVGAALTVPFSDTAMSGLERSLAAKAFARLPERWQAVLWHTEIEQQSPAEVAPILGLTSNGVSALAYRAREGLRQAYLQVHLAETSAARCRATADRLGAWTRSGLSKRERSQVEAHLDECSDCRALAAELADVNGGLRVVIAPLVLGGATLGYLTTAGAAQASSATAATAGATAAASGSGSAAGAAGAVTAGPRQFASTAVSGVAMAAAAALAIAAGGSTQSIPAVAEAPEPRPPQTAQQKPPRQPSPPEPAPQQPPPEPAPPTPSEQPAQPPPPSPSPTPQRGSPSEQPSPPEEPPADLTVNTPQGDLTLVPGATVALPIIVRNTGGSVSEPVTVTLSLPKGVRAVRGGGGGSSLLGRSTALAARSGSSPSNTVYCPPSTGGRAICGTERGLRPGESVKLLFHLSATAAAEPGRITGELDSGATTPIELSIPVTVRKVDDIGLSVDVAEPNEIDMPDWEDLRERPGNRPRSWPWPLQGSLRISVTNSGSSTGTVTVTVTDNARVRDPGGFHCEDQSGTLRCTTNEHVAPGHSVGLKVRLPGYPLLCSQQVTVEASLGTATERTTVTTGWPERDCELPFQHFVPKPPYSVPPVDPALSRPVDAARAPR